MLVSKNFLWDRSHCSIIANLLFPLTIFLKFQSRYGGCDEVKGFPLDGQQLQPLKEQPRNIDAHDRFSRMKFFGLLLILIFVAVMTIYRPPKSKIPSTESERPKFVHSLEELRSKRSVVKIFVEINIYMYIYIYL